MIEQILRMYGLEWVSVLPVQKGYRNQSYGVRLANGDMANLIIYKAESGMTRTIRNAGRVGEFLAARGLPARRPLDPRTVSLYKNRRQCAALYTYLPGHTISWEAYTMRHLKELGAVMAAMHTALAGSTLALPSAARQNIAILERMERYFSDAAVTQALYKKLGLRVQPFFAAMLRLLRGCDLLAAQQPLHLDFVRSNILFDTNARITGILDFEKTACGHPMLDIARTLAFLMVDCKYKTTAQIRKYFLYSGYRKRGARPLAGKRLLEPLTNFYLLYDFYKFLRHNPYESLPQNQHFLSTARLLKQRGMIKWA